MKDPSMSISYEENKRPYRSECSPISCSAPAGMDQVDAKAWIGYKKNNTVFVKLVSTDANKIGVFSSAVPSQINPSTVADFQFRSCCHWRRIDSSSSGS